MRIFGKKMKNILSQRKKTMILAVLAMLSVLSIMTVGPIYAYLKMTSGEVKNTFKASHSATPSIVETFNGSTKSNVYINVGDTGGYSVYVRAAVIVTWKNASGEVLGTEPSYALSIGDDWTPSGGYYYYNTSVPSGRNTTALIESCAPTGPAPVEGYFLSVDVIAQTIQAIGTTDDGNVAAITDAWGVAAPAAG